MLYAFQNSYRVRTIFKDFLPLYGTQTGNINLSSNGNEGVLYTPHISGIGDLVLDTF